VAAVKLNKTEKEFIEWIGRSVKTALRGVQESVETGDYGLACRYLESGHLVHRDWRLEEEERQVNEKKKQLQYNNCRQTMSQPVEMGCCSRGKTGCDGCPCDMSFKDWKEQFEAEQAPLPEPVK
jgi:hypothetical protein